MVQIFLPVFFAVIFYVLSCWDLSNYSDQLNVKVKTFGDKSNPSLVIIPGLDGAVNFFGDVLPELTLKCHVIVFNIPLLKKKMDTKEYTFEYFADELKAVLKSLNVQKVSVVGESFGGVIAQHFALKYSDSVNKLVLLSSLAKTELPPEIQFKLDYLLPIIELFGRYFPSLAQILFAQIHVFDIMEPSEPSFVRELFLREASVAHFYSVMARIRLVSQLNIVDQVKTIMVPSLVVYGADDHFTKEASMQLYALLPNSQMRSLPGGHLPHITSPKEFAVMVLDFVDGDEGQEPLQ